MASVLVVNSGSSSLKYQVIDADTEERLAAGIVERIGEADVHDHAAAFAVMLEQLRASGSNLAEHPPVVVGHRVVHGGARFYEPTSVTPAVLAEIEALSELAPLHNPANAQGIRAAQQAFPGVPQVAVFDTAFHQTIPPEAATYAIDDAVARRYRIRRYGFHGTSHRYVSRATAAFLGRPLAEVRQIVLHLGNGASVCAIDGGRSIDTSMGFTPLEGLVMGSRSGDLDPAVLLHLQRVAGMDAGALDRLLNTRSGIAGLSGHRDMRDLVAAAQAGDERSGLAFGVYLHRIKRYVGAYLAELGGVDAIVFTAGVGENSAEVRSGALAGMGGLGIEVDADRNTAPNTGPRVISSETSRITVLVVPTDEELEIARQSLSIA